MHSLLLYSTLLQFWGIVDVVNLEVKPTPHYLNSEELIKIYENRVLKKNWKSIWTNLKIHHINH
ncbi:nucleotidyltransferase family protein [Heyndrickxia sporothermodurans]|uniref:nucleotidyltransferase family protein n=1 Tax=Heyndrickxia sporothermodurans TaxID=46224 RepID=UPI00389A1CC9